MSEENAQVTTLIAEGRFQEALANLLKERHVGASLTDSQRLLLAELLEKSGRLEDSRIQLARLSRSSRRSDASRARSFLVEGLLEEQRGHLVNARETFRKAWRIAERDGSPELIGWCQLRLLGVSADLNGSGLEGPILSDLRRNIERAGVPALSIAHHIFLAEYYAKQGDLASSRHHTDLAESVLFSYPNIWLRGLLDLHQSCLSYLEGDYVESLLAARRALATSRTSGHRLTELVAQADMAAAYLAVGQPARATACLVSALERSKREEQIFGLLLETLAEAQLTSGDLAGCAESLKMASDISASLSQSRSTWHQSWNLRTEVRLLYRLGNWQAALALIRKAGSRESSPPHSFTRAQIESLEALALVKLGRLGDARDVMQRFVQESLVAANSYRCSVWPALAALEAPTDGIALAESQWMQALRIVGATSEASTLVEMVDQLVGLLRVGSGSDSGSPESVCDKPLWRPVNIVVQLDASSSFVRSVPSEFKGFGALLSALADLGSDPLALGEEALRYLVSMNWLTRGAVIERTDGEVRTVVSYESRGPTEQVFAGCVSTARKSNEVWLGSKRSRHYELHVLPRDSGQAVVACLGMVRLLAALRASQSREPQRTSEKRQSQATLETVDDEALFQSPAMLTLLASAKRVAPLGVNVLLTGESGTGKEVVARIIHRASGAPPGTFVAFNCATVPRDMVDSQLFGYRRGAFTGAAQGFTGVISAADGGTLLLDEVGELPLETQPKLLRFLDSGEVQALGEAIPRKLRVRIIAATNADLDGLVQCGRFREDLFYRLDVVCFKLPPLRERRDEILPLASFFLLRYASEFGKHDIRLSDAVKEHLLLYSWPGNVRQLSHEIRRLVALSEPSSVIDVPALDTRIRGKHQETAVASVPGSRSVTIRIDRTLAEAVHEVESAAIADALKAARGKMEVAATLLGLSRKGLYLKRRRLGL